MGTTIRAIGNATINPIIKPLIHTEGKSGIKPALINVNTKDIENDIIKDIKKANNIHEYFFLIFTIK